MRTPILLKLVALLILLTIISAEITLISPSSNNSSFGLSQVKLSKVDSNLFLLNVSLQVGKLNAEQNENLDLVAVPIYSQAFQRPIYIYYDEKYPSSFSSDFAEVGLIDHLGFLLESNHYQGEITIVNATELKKVLQNNPQSIVIMTSGVLPDTVYGNETNLVTPWLDQGGIMFWVGDEFGAYSGHFEQPVKWYQGLDTQVGQQRILNFTLIQGPTSPTNSYANISSTLSTELGLNYVDVTYGPTIGVILQHGGLVLGKIWEGQSERTSIGAVRVGNGWLIIFGGELGNTRAIDGDDIVASDIFHIVYSSILFSDGNIAFSSIPLLKVKDKVLTANTFLSTSEVSSLVQIDIFAFSTNQYSNIYFEQLVMPPRVQDSA